METGGLKEVANPAGCFGNRAENAPGSVVCACMEGNRPIMVEVQALVAKTPYGMPRRTAVGFDYNRVNMLLAILERRLGMDFGNFDAYLNVVGGMKITEAFGRPCRCGSAGIELPQQARAARCAGGGRSGAYR